MSTIPHGSLHSSFGSLRRFAAIILPFLVLSIFATDPTLGVSCTDPSSCDEPPNQPDFDLIIDCSSNTVVPTICGTPPTGINVSLLRIAVRCFDSSRTPGNERNALFADVHNFAVSGGSIDVGASAPFPTLVTDCNGKYIAAAHWILDGLEAQAQCASNGPSECFPPSSKELNALQERFRLYSHILPQATAGDNSCAPAFVDVSRVEVRNAAIDRAYQGVLAGRYMCPTPDTLGVGNDGSSDAFIACDDPGSQTFPARGQFAHVNGFNIAPQAFFDYKINKIEHPQNPGQFINSGSFNTCCDREVDGEGGITCTSIVDPHMCSPVKIQCASSAVFSSCDGEDVCSQPGAVFQHFNPVVWLGPTVDIDPGSSIHQPSTYSPRACFRFSHSSLTAGEDDSTSPFKFGPAPIPNSFDDECAPAAKPWRDIDFDGIYDECDRFVADTGPGDGQHQVVLKRRIRNVGPTEPWVPASVVRFASEDAAVVGGDADTLVVIVPELNETTPHGIFVTSSPMPEALLQGVSYLPRWLGYASDGTDDGVLVFDTIDQTIKNGNPSPTNSYLNLNCDPANNYDSVGPPIDLATRASESPHFPGTIADREVFSINDVVLAGSGLVESRLFGFDVQNHRTLKADGVFIGLSTRALAVEEDLNGESIAYIARPKSGAFGRISVVNVDPDSTELWQVTHNNTTLFGVPYGIAVHSFGTPPSGKVMAYVTSVQCQISPSSAPEGVVIKMHCIEGPGCGGGGQEGRKVYLSVVDVTDPAAMTVEVTYYLSLLPGAACFNTTAFDNMGLAFKSDFSQLFFVNPDTDSLDVIDTATNELSDVPVGDLPVDVAVAVTGDPPRERIYVLNQGDQNISVIEAAGLRPRSSIPIGDPQDPNLALLLPTAIEARSDGLRLFTADGLHETVSIISLNSNPGTNVWLGDMETQSTATRLALLRLPGPICEDGICDTGEDSCVCAFDCGSPPTNEVDGSTCSDGLDNDCDGFTDCEDSDCPSCCDNGICEPLLSEDQCSCPEDCDTPPTSEVVGSTCSDGFDNDCDGFKDCEDDPDCRGESGCCVNTICNLTENCDGRDGKVSCLDDCPGVTSGNPNNRWCCGNGIPEVEFEGADCEVCGGNC